MTDDDLCEGCIYFKYESDTNAYICISKNGCMDVLSRRRKRMEIKTTQEITMRLKKPKKNTKWIAVDDMLKLINQKLIMTPHYTDGETHLQYLERYKQYLIKQIKQEAGK